MDRSESTKAVLQECGATGAGPESMGEASGNPGTGMLPEGEAGRGQEGQPGVVPALLGALGRAQPPTDPFTHSSSKDVPVHVSGSSIPDSEVSLRTICTVIK